MKVSRFKMCIFIITGIALTLNLLIFNSMSKNRRKSNTNMLISQNFKNNQIKYSKK